MKKYIVSILAILIFGGCTGTTTDPRQGGLFSYNPKAYEERLTDRENQLSSIEKDTAAQKRKSTQLKKQL